MEAIYRQRKSALNLNIILVKNPANPKRLNKGIIIIIKYVLPYRKQLAPTRASFPIKSDAGIWY